jgi:hypothetical protein
MIQWIFRSESECILLAVENQEIGNVLPKFSPAITSAITDATMNKNRCVIKLLILIAYLKLINQLQKYCDIVEKKITKIVHKLKAKIQAIAQNLSFILKNICRFYC